MMNRHLPRSVLLFPTNAYKRKIFAPKQTTVAVIDSDRIELLNEKEEDGRDEEDDCDEQEEEDEDGKERRCINTLTTTARATTSNTKDMQQTVPRGKQSCELKANVREYYY